MHALIALTLWYAEAVGFFFWGGVGREDPLSNISAGTGLLPMAESAGASERRSGQLGTNIKVRIFKSNVIAAVLLYGCETWRN